MSNYSVDDILAELDKKRGGTKKAETGISVTAELEQIENLKKEERFPAKTAEKPSGVKPTSSEKPKIVPSEKVSRKKNAPISEITAKPSSEPEKKPSSHGKNKPRPIFEEVVAKPTEGEVPKPILPAEKPVTEEAEVKPTVKQILKPIPTEEKPKPILNTTQFYKLDEKFRKRSVSGETSEIKIPHVSHSVNLHIGETTEIKLPKPIHNTANLHIGETTEIKLPKEDPKKTEFTRPAPISAKKTEAEPKKPATSPAEKPSKPSPFIENVASKAANSNEKRFESLWATVDEPAPAKKTDKSYDFAAHFGVNATQSDKKKRKKEKPNKKKRSFFTSANEDEDETESLPQKPKTQVQSAFKGKRPVIEDVPPEPVEDKTDDFTINDITFEYPEKVNETEDKTMVMPAPHKLSDTEKEELRQRRDHEALLRESRPHSPDELIDELNPLEFSGETKILPPLTKNSEPVIETLPTGNEPGDTLGIAGNDLKELAESSKKIKTPEEKVQSLLKNAEAETAEDSGEVKEYHLERGDALYSKRARQYSNDEKTEKERRSSTALIESLNQQIAKKRQSDIDASRTMTLTGSNFSPTIQPITHGLNIDYGKQVIPDTDVILSADPVVAEQKIKELSAKRKRKIRDFVLEDIDDNTYGEENQDEDDDEDEDDDFDGYDSSSEIWNDLCESHRALKTRFALLFILTAFIGLVTVLNDIGGTLTFDFFGNAVNFLDKRYDPSGYVYLNLIVGVLGAILCSSVIFSGITKLFTGKGDCDSLCAVSSLIALITTCAFLSNTDYLQRSRAFIYIPVMLAALLFNTAGKLLMIARAKRNFRFVSGDTPKYSVSLIPDDTMATAFTKGAVNELPVLATMRKTEFLTDFLKESYCTDLADKLSRGLSLAALGFGVLLGVLAYFIPNGEEGMSNNIYWAMTVLSASLSALSPFSLLFVVNNPLNRAQKALSKSGAVVLGYNAAQQYSETNSVLVDATALFPDGSVKFNHIKRYQAENSINNIIIDEAVILAASLAVKSKSILATMFYDMIACKSKLLKPVDNCIYEDNMGVMGWIGNKRMMLGNRSQMKHHGIKVPNEKKEKEYCKKYGELVYLAVGGEVVAMFFMHIIPNEGVKNSIRSLVRSGIHLMVKTNDSLVTVEELSDIFDIPTDAIKIIPYNLHNEFEECTKYVSRGNGALACSENFSSFARALVTAKRIVRDIMTSSAVMFLELFLAAILLLVFMLFVMPSALTPTNLIVYNSVWLIIMLIIQRLRRY